jgi:hypothetical protein
MIFHNKLFIIYSIFRCDHVLGCTNVTISTLSGEGGKQVKWYIKIIAKSKIDTSNTQIHYRSLSWLGTGTSIKSGVVKLVLL